MFHSDQPQRRSIFASKWSHLMTKDSAVTSHRDNMEEVGVSYGSEQSPSQRHLFRLSTQRDCSNISDLSSSKPEYNSTSIGPIIRMPESNISGRASPTRMMQTWNLRFQLPLVSTLLRSTPSKPGTARLGGGVAIEPQNVQDSCRYAWELSSKQNG